MARGFGEEIAAGLEKRLKVLGERVERATGRFQWTTALTWGIGIGLGMVLTIAIGVWAFTPKASGLTDNQVRAAIAQLVPCQVDRDRQVCIKLDNRPHMSKLPGGAPIAAVRGL